MSMVGELPIVLLIVSGSLVGGRGMGWGVLQCRRESGNA